MLKTSFWIKLFICHKQRERHLTMTLFVSFSMQIFFLSFLYPELPFLLLELLPAWFMYSTDSNSDDTGVCGELVLHNCVFLPQVSLHFTPRWWRLPRRKINTPLFSCADFWTLLLWHRYWAAVWERINDYHLIRFQNNWLIVTTVKSAKFFLS